MFINFIITSCSSDNVARVPNDVKEVIDQVKDDSSSLQPYLFDLEKFNDSQTSNLEFSLGNNSNKTKYDSYSNKSINVAILLPLTGPSADIGQSLLYAAQMALFDTADERFKLFPYDTEGTPDGAIRASSKAISENVELILGPVFSSSTKAIIPNVEKAGLVMVPFTTDPTVAQPGVFILGFLVHEQIRRIINFGISQNILRYAVLAPGTPYGETIVDTMQQVVMQAGGELSKIAYYEPSGANLNDVVKEFADYDRRYNLLVSQKELLLKRDDPVSLAALERLEQLDTIGDVKFDAILIPESGARLAEVAALLPFYDVDPGRVQLMGTLLWHISGLGKEPSLVGGWYPAPSPQQNSDFYKRFKSIYGYKPPAISTHGYDSVALASILARNYETNPYNINNFLLPNGFSGVDGVFRFTRIGLSERGFAVLEVTRESAVSIDEAPTTFEAN